MSPLEPMDPQLTWDQPGGGVIVHLELAWGRFRRWRLKTFHRGYVERMRGTRRGDFNGCPHEVLDPRDLKFFQNQGGYSWAPEDDPFAHRSRLPFAREGLAELFVFSVLKFGGAAVCLSALALLQPPTTAAVLLAVLALTLTVIGGLIVWFFRNPQRDVPTAPGLVVSPADGTIAEVVELPHDEFVGGPAVQIGIFLSIFNVHINRAPEAARVIGLSYRPGKHLNALKPESARENEQLTIRLQSPAPPHRRFVVRQIAGAIARRIVCRLKPGDDLQRGESFGMIKLGSRTELVLPRGPGLQVEVRAGQKVQAGATVLARYAPDDIESNPLRAR